MTAELMTAHNNRKFIPILRHTSWLEAAPSWLVGRYYIDLSGGSRFERNYEVLLATLHGHRLQSPPVGRFSNQRDSPLVGEGANPRSRLKKWLVQRDPFPVALGLVIAAGLVTFAILFGTQRIGSPLSFSDLEEEAARLNSKEPSAIDHSSELDFTLYPNMIRGDGERSTLIPTSKTEIIRLHLLLLADSTKPMVWS